MGQKIHLIKEIPGIRSCLYKGLGSNIIAYIEDFGAVPYTLQLIGMTMSGWLFRFRADNNISHSSLYLENGIYDSVDSFVGDICAELELDATNNDALFSILAHNMIESVIEQSIEWIGYIIRTIQAATGQPLTYKEYIGIQVDLLTDTTAKITIMDEDELYE